MRVFFASLRRKLTGVPHWQGVSVRAAASGHRPDHGVSACCHHPGRSLRSDISSPPRDVLLCLSALLCPVCESEQTTHNKAHQKTHTHTYLGHVGLCWAKVANCCGGGNRSKEAAPRLEGSLLTSWGSLGKCGLPLFCWGFARQPFGVLSVLGFAEARQLQLASSRVSCSQSHLAWLCWTSLVRSLICQEGQGWPLLCIVALAGTMQLTFAGWRRAVNGGESCLAACYMS